MLVWCLARRGTRIQRGATLAIEGGDGGDHCLDHLHLAGHQQARGLDETLVGGQRRGRRDDGLPLLDAGLAAAALGMVESAQGFRSGGGQQRESRPAAQEGGRQRSPQILARQLEGLRVGFLQHRLQAHSWGSTPRQDQRDGWRSCLNSKAGQR